MVRTATEYKIVVTGLIGVHSIKPVTTTTCIPYHAVSYVYSTVLRINIMHIILLYCTSLT